MPLPDALPHPLPHTLADTLTHTLRLRCTLGTRSKTRAVPAEALTRLERALAERWVEARVAHTPCGRLAELTLGLEVEAGVLEDLDAARTEAQRFLARVAHDQRLVVEWHDTALSLSPRPSPDSPSDLRGQHTGDEPRTSAPGTGGPTTARTSAPRAGDGACARGLTGEAEAPATTEGLDASVETAARDARPGALSRQACEVCAGPVEVVDDDLCCAYDCTGDSDTNADEAAPDSPGL